MEEKWKWMSESRRGSRGKYLVEAVLLKPTRQRRRVASAEGGRIEALQAPRGVGMGSGVPCEEGVPCVAD